MADCSICGMYIPSYDTVTYHQSCDQERRSDMAQAIGRRQVAIDQLRRDGDTGARLYAACLRDLTDAHARILELETALALAYAKKPADGAAG